MTTAFLNSYKVTDQQCILDTDLWNCIFSLKKEISSLTNLIEQFLTKGVKYSMVTGPGFITIDGTQAVHGASILLLNSMYLASFRFQMVYFHFRS